MDVLDTNFSKSKKCYFFVHKLYLSYQYICMMYDASDETEPTTEENLNITLFGGDSLARNNDVKCHLQLMINERAAQSVQ